MGDADTLRARVLAAAAATPSPTRREKRRSVATLLLASVVVALALFEGAGGLEHAKGRPLSITLAIAGGWGLFCAALSWITLGRGRSTLGRAPALIFLAALATPALLIAWMHVFDGSYVEPFVRFGWRCFGYNLLMAALPLVSLLVLRRGAEPRSPWALGAGIGAVCGAWAGVLVDLWCPLTNLPHVLFGHVLPVALLVAAGALLGQRTLGVR